jgi:hypothetical protein
VLTPVNNSYPLDCFQTIPMELSVYMHSWIVGDGNYSDFCEEETRQFALEFWAPGLLARSQLQEKSFAKGDRYTYGINARVAFSSPDILVIDFGLLAYSESSTDLQLGFKEGDYVTGQVALGVDPFFYFERLSKLQDVPALIYEWRIDSIEQETTPFMIGEVCGRAGYVRDESKTSFAQVGSTSEFISNPNDVAPSYVLNCTKLEAAPMKQFSLPQRW